jgi:hypothetical protein
MKKSRFFLIAASMVVFSMFATAIESFALRVLDYTYNCVGSGGNCLDTVVIPPADQ